MKPVSRSAVDIDYVETGCTAEIKHGVKLMSIGHGVTSSNLAEHY